MKTTEVFGVSNEQIFSYIERRQVDERFLEGLQRNKHIIVFGASKQGKTALTNKHLKEKDFIRINCSSQTKVIDVYKSILRQLDVEFEEERSEKTLVEGSGKGGVKAKVKIPFFADSEASTEITGRGSREESTRYKLVEYNLGLPQDISEILRSIGFKQRIIIENFHYLEEEIQKEVAFHLRVFEDFNVLFVILGIWREKNRLAQYNGDLQDRLIEIPVEPWSEDDFRKVSRKGGEALGVSFDGILAKIINSSFDSIGVFQELHKECCLAAGLQAKSKNLVVIDERCLEIAIERKLGDYSGRHFRSLETFMEQQARTSDEVPLYLGYYFVKVLLNLDFKDIETGLKRKFIHNEIRKIHHRADDVRSSDMSYFLYNIVQAQIKKDIVPPLFDYDRGTKTIKIIDSTLYFFLRNADKEEIISEFEIPEGIN
ncbi:MAG: ATP-binding protein [Phormidesmis sp. CAN_BIN44]|nr:ATP-binding protein [Phormidesmis sp. CAN_BIN44]